MSATATILSSCTSHLILSSRKPQLLPRLFVGVGQRILNQLIAKQNRSYYANQKKTLTQRFSVYAATEGSAKSSESEETIPSWAKPDSDKPPPWASGEGKDTSQKSFEFPFFVYLLASAVIAIAAIGSMFEYANQNPVFGIVKSDSIFYAPLLGFFVFTGFPTSAFLWFKSVQVANKEAEEQNKRDGYM
ncbi:hypothetical protein ACOSP7_031213 [Xanthoceras sorbifolium]|uniref:Transmembrane protein n=1 Tax=Xanthoceras sorbifolium TaxID=99658 RepID=A0ABQ8H102_9ROSI|nr:hypothetical protein JRO89_XS15G0053500 [Xanthoceras sorbifolium]